GRHVEIDVAHDRLAFAVGEADVLEGHASLQTRTADGGGGAGDLDGRVEYLEDAAGADQGLLHAVDERGHLVDLAGELFEQAGEDHQAGAEGELAAHDLQAAEAEQDHDVDAGEQADRGGEQADAPEDTLLLGEHRAGFFKEGLAVLGFAAEGLGDLHALHALGEVLHHAVDQPAALRVAGLYSFREYGRHDRQHRGGGQAGDGQRRAEAGHEDDVNRQRDDHDHALDHDLIDKHAHGLHVTGHAGDDRAGGVGVEEAEAEALELVIDLAAQIDDEVALHEDVDREGVGVVEQRAQRGEAEDAASDGQQDQQRFAAGRQRRQKAHVRQGNLRIHHVPDVVDAQAGERQAGQAEGEQHQLQGQH